MSETVLTRISSAPRNRRWLAAGLAWAAENARELVFAIGLALLATGLALVSVALALSVTGALLVWLAIPPTRPPAE